MSTLTTARFLNEVAQYLKSVASTPREETPYLFVFPSTDVMAGKKIMAKQKVQKKLKNKAPSIDSRKRMAALHLLKKYLQAPRYAQMEVLLEANEMEEFYIAVITELAGLLDSQTITDARIIAEAQVSREFCEGQLRNIQNRGATRQTGIVVEHQAEFDTSNLIAPCGKSLDETLRKQAVVAAKRNFKRLKHLAEYSPVQAVDELRVSLEASKLKHTSVLQVLIDGLKVVPGDTELLRQQAEERSELLAIDANMDMLRELTNHVSSWDALDSAVQAVDERLKNRAEQSDYIDSDIVRQWQAWSSILTQLNEKKMRHQAARQDLQIFVAQAASEKRAKLAQIPNGNSSEYEIRTAEVMKQTLLDLGFTNLKGLYTFFDSLDPLLSLAKVVELDNLGHKLTGEPDWFPFVVAEYYFTTDPQLAKAWQQLYEALKDMYVLNIRDLLNYAAELAAKPDDIELLEYLVETRYAERVRDLKKFYEMLISKGAHLQRAYKVLSMWVEMEPIFNDEPFYKEVILQRFAFSTEQEPLTLLYIGCLRHKYPDGVHTILPDLREIERHIVFERLVKLAEAYGLPVTPVVCVSDPELYYIKQYDFEHPNSVAARKYVEALAKVCQYETLAFSSFLVKHGLDKLYADLLQEFYAKAYEAHRASIQDAWFGWHHGSVQEEIEREWLSRARVEIVRRDDANIMGYRQIAKAMADGAVFSRFNAQHPLIVFATGKRAGAVKELNGPKAVQGAPVGYVFLPLPDFVDLTVEDEIELAD